MASKQSNLPAPTGGVFTAQTSISIDAPIERVWSILLDFPNYSAWNPFVHSQTIVDKNGHALSDQTPTEGSRLLLGVDMPVKNSTELMSITAVDHTQYRVAWCYADVLPRFLLTGERWQVLSVIDDGGNTKVLYENREEFNGPAAFLIKWFVGKKVVAGFENTALALKNRAESA